MYEMSTIWNTSFTEGARYDLRDDKTQEKVHSSDLRNIFAKGGISEDDTNVSADITIRLHDKGLTEPFYTITFAGKAIRRLDLNNHDSIIMCVHDSRPDAIYFEPINKTFNRERGVYKIRKLKNGTYQVQLNGKAQLNYIGDFTDQAQVRQYALFEDKGMDEAGHYMIRKGYLWEENRRRRTNVKG